VCTDSFNTQKLSIQSVHVSRIFENTYNSVWILTLVGSKKVCICYILTLLRIELLFKK